MAKPPDKLNKVINYIGQVGVANLPTYREVSALLGVSNDTIGRAIEAVTKAKVHSDLARLIDDMSPTEVIWREENEDDGRVVTVKYKTEKEKPKKFVANLHDPCLLYTSPSPRDS